MSRELILKRRLERSSWTLATPLVLVLSFFLVLPLLTIIMVSFWDYNEYTFFPAFIFGNYEYLLTSKVTLATYLKTLKFTVLTWFFCTIIGFTVAYFLAFHIRSLTWQIALFLLCTIPFWTSNIIRMISWIPFLGRNGIANSILLDLGIIEQPWNGCCSRILLSYGLCAPLRVVHGRTRIQHNDADRQISDRGGTGCRCQRISNPDQCDHSPKQARSDDWFDIRRDVGYGRLVTVRFMSGGQSASVGRVISNEIALLQYPAAAASAVVLLCTVLIMISVMLRFVDIRKEL